MVPTNGPIPLVSTTQQVKLPTKMDLCTVYDHALDF